MVFYSDRQQKSHDSDEQVENERLFAGLALGRRGEQTPELPQIVSNIRHEES